ncbi:Bax inhibitor-1/YccA family protein [Fusobacterium vincentii]|mgnify:FL=1|uniref:Bax inhibitor-1/YccA family protein n=1 Tax=Fusobacterium vincentii TaxID=155615 RepID=UPI001C6E4EF2|nr:Bax inhibitor-1/YccA family protein [Fusobacterium vincentii]QYR56944.1 Bax inhibitor-1/YccA family protein [Fusobacterium vincentii]
MYYNMNDIDIKSSNNLLRKVFLYMILGIAISFGTGAYLLYFNQGLLSTLFNYYQFLVIAELAMVFSISFFINKISSSLAKILFFAYSLVNGITLTVIGFIYAPQIIFYAFMITLTIFVVTAIYGYTTQEDLSSYRRFFMIALISLIILSIINAFMGVGMLEWVITIGGVVIFTGLIAYDVNRIKFISYQLADGDNEAMEKMGIIGALNLYLDFINLFIYILRIFGRKK